MRSSTYTFHSKPQTPTYPTEPPDAAHPHPLDSFVERSDDGAIA